MKTYKYLHIQPSKIYDLDITRYYLFNSQSISLMLSLHILSQLVLFHHFLFKKIQKMATISMNCLPVKLANLDLEQQLQQQNSSCKPVIMILDILQLEV